MGVLPEHVDSSLCAGVDAADPIVAVVVGARRLSVDWNMESVGRGRVGGSDS